MINILSRISSKFFNYLQCNLNFIGQLMPSVWVRLFVACVLLFFVPSVFAQPLEMTLEECKELALENNQQLEVARYNRLASESLRKAAYTKFFPGFDFAGSYLRMNKQFNLLEEDMLLPVVPSSAINTQTGKVDQNLLLNPDLHSSGAGVMFHNGKPIMDDDGNPVFYRYTWLPADHMSFGQSNNFLFNLGMTQPIYTGGKIRTQYQITSQIETIAQQAEKLEASEVLYETEKLFWKVYTLQEKLTLAEKYHSLLEDMVEDFKHIYDEGIISQNELLKARVKKNEANLDRIKARNGLELSKMALCRMIGLPISSDVEVKDTLWIDDSAGNLDDMLYSALNNRPELAIASTNVELGESAVKLAKSRFLPDIALSANYFMVNPDPYKGFNEQFGRDWNIGLVMRIPLFHWNERRHVLNLAKHTKTAQELKLKDYEELIQLEVNKVYYEVSEAYEKVNITALSLEQAAENLRLAEDNFEVGKITTTELIEAQTLWHKAYSNKIDAKSNLKLLQTNMQKAIGRLFDD